MTYEESYQQHGSMAKAANALGISKTGFIKKLQKERVGAPVKKPAPPSVGLTEQELLLRHSPEHKLLAAAQGLERGVFLAQGQFIKAAGVTGSYRDIIERPEFEQFRGKVSESVVYWGHPESIKKMKDSHVLH